MRILLGLMLLISCQSKTQQRIGGTFENSKATYQQMPELLTNSDTTDGWKEPGQKLVINGTVYQADGKTPARDVMIYYYHTNTSGKYLHDPGKKRSMAPNEKGQTHGYLRGWVKTGDDGKYRIYTVRPGVYPTRDEPAHIHLTIKESGFNEYYIDDIVFDDDILLNAAKRRRLENRAGSGIVRTYRKDSVEYGQRDILLGLNIPGHPARKSKPVSGNSVGEEVFSFMPYHAWGPDKGTRTCPVCKYGKNYGILFFSGENADWDSIEKWITFLEKESKMSGSRLKCYFTCEDKNVHEPASKLENLGRTLNVQHVALTYVPSFDDEESEVKYININPAVKNTFIIYRNHRIIGNYSNLEPTDENFERVQGLIR
jgi:protocatechuate 3,4-dioxygenase, beta subunit